MRTLGLVLSATITVALLGGLGSAVVAQEASDAPFPTGTFISEENRYLLLELDEDGTGSFVDVHGGWSLPLSYAVDGDRYTESSNDLTYRWRYDGERLEFVELVRGDETWWREFAYGENTYRLVSDPRIVVIAATDIEAGEPIPLWKMQRGFVPAADDAMSLPMDPDDFVGSVPRAPIAKGEPITLEKVMPAE